MAYGDFDLAAVKERFGLRTREDRDLFAEVTPVPVPERLLLDLDRWAPEALATNTERARAELIIAPVLKATAELAGRDVRLFVGVTFDVDKAQGLNGVCDYLLSRTPERYYIEAPVLAVVEAKKEDLAAALGQCAAEMVAARLFHDRKGRPLSAIHGAVTSGSNWRFLRLEDEVLSIDSVEYHLRELTKLLAILHVVTTAAP